MAADEDTKPTITCVPDGSYRVKNLTILRNDQGELLPHKPAMALCRCGRSKNKPFCDATHKKIGFEAEIIATSLEGDGVLDESEEPYITVYRDGPYEVSGGVALDGVPIKGETPARYWLCRCGRSKNKPLCDSSHRECGFKDGE